MPTLTTAPSTDDCASTIRFDSLGLLLSLLPLTWILAHYKKTVLPFTTYLGIVLPLPYLLAFIPESMATIYIVLVVIVDFESVCTYKSLFGFSAMLQSSFCRVRELLRVLLRISPCRGWPCFGFSKVPN
jgi:hypothetical protein